MDCIVHGVARSQTRLSDFHFHFPCVREDFSYFSAFELEHGLFSYLQIGPETVLSGI